MPTEEQQKEAQGRIEAFRKEYDALCEKYDVGHATQPFYIAVGDGTYTTAVIIEVVDRKYRSVPSPFKGK